MSSAPDPNSSTASNAAATHLYSWHSTNSDTAGEKKSHTVTKTRYANAAKNFYWKTGRARNIDFFKPRF